MNCYYCKKPLTKNEYNSKSIGGQDICKECADGQRQVLAMFAGLGGRRLI